MLRKYANEPEPHGVREGGGGAEGNPWTTSNPGEWRVGRHSDTGSRCTPGAQLGPHTVSTLPFKGLLHQYLCSLALAAEVGAAGRHAQHFKNRRFSYKRIVHRSPRLVPVVIETGTRCRGGGGNQVQDSSLLYSSIFFGYLYFTQVFIFV